MTAAEGAVTLLHSPPTNKNVALDEWVQRQFIKRTPSDYTSLTDHPSTVLNVENSLRSLLQGVRYVRSFGGSATLSATAGRLSRRINSSLVTHI